MGTDHGLAEAFALHLRNAIADGTVTAAGVADAFLARIALREPEVGGFTAIDPERVRAEARQRDAWQAAGKPLGPLHGLPVAVKDIIDTADMPTENGTPLDAGRRPARDSVVVARLRAAGAVILGKTVTTELGAMFPRGTRNPHHAGHTPGGSSSGSAAAVGAGMVPLAVGTQTNGSVIRPAAFCGVVGYKPTFGTIPRTGILPQARPLDTVGVFARSVTDAALLADALAGPDDSDPDSRAAPGRVLDAALVPPQSRPSFVLARTPSWPQAEPTTQAAFEALAGALACREGALPPICDDAIATHTTIAMAGIAWHYGPYHDRDAGALSDWMRGAIEDGRRIAAVDYLAALDRRDRIHDALVDALGEDDVFLTPAAPGEAPAALARRGAPPSTRFGRCAACRRCRCRC